MCSLECCFSRVCCRGGSGVSLFLKMHLRSGGPQLQNFSSCCVEQSQLSGITLYLCSTNLLSFPFFSLVGSSSHYCSYAKHPHLATLTKLSLFVLPSGNRYPFLCAFAYGAIGFKTSTSSRHSHGLPTIQVCLRSFSSP